MEVYREVDVLCNECGKTLKANMCNDDEITVELCIDCVDKERADAREEGYTDGLAAGNEGAW